MFIELFQETFIHTSFLINFIVTSEKRNEQLVSEPYVGAIFLHNQLFLFNKLCIQFFSNNEQNIRIVISNTRRTHMTIVGLKYAMACLGTQCYSTQCNCFELVYKEKCIVLHQIDKLSEPSDVLYIPNTQHYSESPYSLYILRKFIYIYNPQ